MHHSSCIHPVNVYLLVTVSGSGQIFILDYILLYECLNITDRGTNTVNEKKLLEEFNLAELERKLTLETRKLKTL